MCKYVRQPYKASELNGEDEQEKLAPIQDDTRFLKIGKCHSL